MSTNDLIMGSKYEDTQTIAAVTRIETNYIQHFHPYFQEMMQNYKRVAGYIYSEADLNKLRIEERPSFVYNLLLPKMMNLAGAFINNESKVEAQPRTPGDFQLSAILCDLLDFGHYTVNNLSREQATAFMCAAIGRVGWIYQYWSYLEDPEGNMIAENFDPFRLMWDGGQPRRGLKRANCIIDRGWYTPEELINIFGQDDEDLAAEIYEKAKMYLGHDPKKDDKLIRFIERIWGRDLSYKGDDQGYDSVTRLVDGLLYNNGNYFDTIRGMFKVTEAHERRMEKVLVMYDPTSNQELNATKFVNFSKDGKKWDDQKMAILQQNYPFAKYFTRTINQIYQTSVCPAMNLKLYDAPYDIQNGNMKFTPTFCFDFGPDSLEWKSYVDLLKDPVASFNLNQNTIQTYLMKSTHGETWVEDDALGDHEAEFLQNKIGAVKYVNKGTIAQAKIKRIDPPILPNSLLQQNDMNMSIMATLSGLHDNSEGAKETANEPGVAVQMRINQSDKMMAWVQDNAIQSLIPIGQNTLSYYQHYLTPGRLLKICQDETNPYWLQINQDSIDKFVYDSKGNLNQTIKIPGNIKTVLYDIILSKVPFGQGQKDREFQQVMYVSNALALINPALVSPEIMVKSSGMRLKDEYLAHIKRVIGDGGQGTLQEQQQLAMDIQQRNLKMKADNLKIAEKTLKVQDMQNEQGVDNLLLKTFKNLNVDPQQVLSNAVTGSMA